MCWIPGLHGTPCKAGFIAGSGSCTATGLSGLVAEGLRLVRAHCAACCGAVRVGAGVGCVWVVGGSLDVIRVLGERRLSLNHVSAWDFSTLYASLPHAQLGGRLHGLLERVFNTKGESFVAAGGFRTFWTNGGASTGYTCFSCGELCLAIDFLVGGICVRFGGSVFRQVVGVPVGTSGAPLLAGLFLHTFEYDFMVKTVGRDIAGAVQFGSAFRCIDDLFGANGVGFGDCIGAICPSGLELKDTSASSAGVCCLGTGVGTGGDAPFRVGVYGKREDFAFRVVSFPHMDSGIPAGPACGVCISRLVRCAGVCASRVGFINRLRGLSLRLRRRGFGASLLRRSFDGFFTRRGLVVGGCGAALRGVRLAIQA